MMKQSTSFAQGANKLFLTIARLRLLLVMFLTLTVTTNAWAETWTWNATNPSELGSSTDNTITLNGKEWETIRSKGTNQNQLQNSCIQIGSRFEPQTITLQSNAFSGKILEVSVECASYNGAHKISIQVGSTTYLSSTTTPTWTTISTKTGSGTSSGQIVISFTDGSRALYIKSISVTYEEGITEPSYSVTSNLSHITGDPANPTSVLESAEELTLSYSAESGWNLPDAISVTMGGNQLMLNDGYTWDKETGTVWIAPANGFTGNIVVTINGWQQLATPTNLSVPNITSTSATLSWGEVANASNYLVTIVDGGDLSANIPNTQTSHTFEGLTPSTVYLWTVKAIGDGITYTNSEESKTAEFTTLKACEQLGAATGLTVETDFVQDGQTYVKFSWTPADNTKNYARNQKICFGKVDEAGTCVDNLAKNLTWTGDLKSKLEPGEYWWSIQALGDGVNYCDGDVVNGTNFTIEAPKASITLSELGVTTTDNTTYYVGAQYTLPTISSQSCAGKQLVGWSTGEVAETDTKPTENYYELGAKVTLAETQTFYAVFATANGEGDSGSGYRYIGDETLLTIGKKYIFVSTNTAGNAFALKASDLASTGTGTKGTAVAVTVTSVSEEMLVATENTDLEFEAVELGEDYTLRVVSDDTKYLYINGSGIGYRDVPRSYYDATGLYGWNNNGDKWYDVYYDASSQRFIQQESAKSRVYAYEKQATTTYSAYSTSCIPTYSITYDFAGGDGGHCTDTRVEGGSNYTICDEAPTKEGYTFLHWSDGVNTYNPSDVIENVTADITLTAVWQIKTYTVTWSNNGATTPVEYNHGDALVVPEAPESCDGVKEFVGWTTHSGYYHATTAPTDLFKTTTATVTADKTYYAVFATRGEGSANFVLGESGTFKMYANVEGTNYYAQGGVSGGKITSTTEAANASDYTLTYAAGVYTIKQGTSNVGNAKDDANLNTNETTWTISEGTNGSWRVNSNVNTSRALSYSTSASAFKAYSINNITGSPTSFYDIEFGGTSSGYSDYTTTCQQVESIEVQSPQTEFNLTDKFTIGSGKVIATLSGGGTTDVTALATFSGYNMNVVGTYTVTVTYMGATATYNINVKPLDNAWVLTWNVSGKTNTGLGPRSVTKGSAIGTLPTPEVPAACEGKTFMGWTKSNIVPSDGKGIVYITPETKPTDNTTYYAVFATVNNFCTQKPIDQIASGSKVVIVAVASLTDDGGAGMAISSRATDDTHNLQGDDVAIYDQTINTPHSTCIWTITKSGEKYIFTQDGKYLNGIIDGKYSNLKYNGTSDSWTLTPAASGMAMTYNMKSTNASTEYVEWYNEKFTIHEEVNNNGDFDMQFFVTANAEGNADITDYTTGCEEYTITYYGFRGGYSTSTSSDGIIVLPVNSLHTVPNCGDVVKDHTNLGREFLDVWMTQPHGGHTFKPGDTFILTQDTTLYAQWKMETTSDVTTLPTDIEDMAGTDIYVYGGKTLNIQPGTTTINSLTLKGGLQADGSYKMPTVWVPEGATLVRNSNKIYLDLVVNAKNYYPFAVPFAAKNNENVEYLDPVLAAASTYGTHFVIKTYNGARRATQGEDRANNWVKVLRDETLQPGVGYIITALTYPTKDTATIRIPMTVPNTWFNNGEQTEVGTTVRNTIAVTAHAGAAATEHKRHAGWNFVANPYLTSFAGGNVANDGGLAYINGELTVNGGWQYGGDNVPYVTIPAYDFSYYSQHKLSDVKLSPEWSFFVQVGTGGTMNFTTAGRQEIPASIAARHDAAQSIRMDVDIVLSDKHHSDQTGIIISDRFTSAYEIGRDLEKLFGSAFNLSVYTLMEDNTPLAYQALAIHSNMQIIPVGYRVPEQGEYTFRLNEATSSIDLLNEQYEQLILVDYETGALTNLLNSSYTFTSPRTQSNSRFAIYAVMRQGIPTDLPNIDDGDTSTRKILHNGHLYILRDGKVYNGHGQIVKQ